MRKAHVPSDSCWQQANPLEDSPAWHRDDPPPLMPCGSQCKALITENHAERPVTEFLECCMMLSRQNQGLKKDLCGQGESIGSKKCPKLQMQAAGAARSCFL